MRVVFEPGDCFILSQDGSEFFGEVLSHKLPDGSQAFVMISESEISAGENRVTFLTKIIQESPIEKENMMPIRRDIIPSDIEIRLNIFCSGWYYARENPELLNTSDNPKSS